MRPCLPFIASALVALGSDAAAQGPLGPSGIDYDTVDELGYSEYVQPLLAARHAFASASTSEAGALEAYAWEALFEGEAGAAVVPFDAEGSPLVRYVEDLPDTVAIPYPNLRRLQPDELRYLKRWIEAGARNDAGAVPYGDAQPLLFAAVQGENHVAIIDAARRRVIRRVYFDDHGLPSAPYGPHHVVFDPDASTWTVSLISAGAVATFRMDLQMDPSDPAYRLAASEPGAFTTPGMMALDADAGRLYVGRSTLSSSGTFGVGVFDAATLAPVEEFALPGYDIPHALALTPDGRHLVTAPLVGHHALVLDAHTGDLVSQTPVGGTRELVHANVLPDGSTATLTANAQDGGSAVLFFEIAADGSLTPTGSAPTGARAWHAHLDGDGRTLLVPNRADGSVTLIDVPTQRVRMTAENPAVGGPLAMPHSPAPAHAGVLFVSNSNLQGTWTPPHRFLDADPDGDGVREPLPASDFGNVAALDAATGAVVAVIPLGRYPSGLEHWHGAGGHGGPDGPRDGAEHGGHHGH
ncbi:MAG: hypothetical protein R3362_09550 [Rhodothermales bacterium]|nr:hypothetical protein [Rhodothermales bacterium]